MISTGVEHPADGSSTAEAVRLGLSASLCAAAAAHLPVLADHLHEAPWLGCLFIVFIATSLAIGALGISRPRDRWAPIAALLMSGAIAFYIATRAVAFPQISDDVGDWFDPWGVASVVAETGGLVLALLLIVRRGAPDSDRAGALFQDELAKSSQSDETEDGANR